MENSIYISDWSEKYLNGDDILERIIWIIENQNPKIIYYDILHEYIFMDTTIEKTRRILSDVDLYLRKYDIQLYISFSVKKQKIFEIYDWFTNIHVIFFPLFHVGWLVNNYHNAIQKKQDIKRYNFDHFFLCLNHRPHWHRCHLMDALAKHDLLNSNSVYTWNKLRDFNFNHWNQEIIKYGDFEFDKMGYLEEHLLGIIDETNCFINLVAETTHSVEFITEKTWKPILYKQLFLSFGGVNQNLNLKKYGFELYDEIIDYEFDSNEDFYQRLNGVIENLKNLKDIDYNKAIDKVQDKIDYNYNHAIKMVKENKHIPETYMKLYQEYKNEFENAILSANIECVFYRPKNEVKLI